jgi:hypothetical protein
MAHQALGHPWPHISSGPASAYIDAAVSPLPPRTLCHGLSPLVVARAPITQTRPPAVDGACAHGRMEHGAHGDAVLVVEDVHVAPTVAERLQILRRRGGWHQGGDELALT